MNFPNSFETDRLHLRTPRLEDAPIIFEAYAQDEEVCRYMTWLPYEQLDDYESWLEGKIKSIGVTTSTYVICPIDDPSKPIGMVDAQIDTFKAEVGYALSKDEWGKGLMTEAVASFVDLLLSHDSICRVSAVCDLDNPASSRVMEKSGMSYEGVLKNYIIHPNISNKPRDAKCYSKITSSTSCANTLDAI